MTGETIISKDPSECQHAFYLNGPLGDTIECWSCGTEFSIPITELVENSPSS